MEVIHKESLKTEVMNQNLPVKREKNKSMSHPKKELNLIEEIYDLNYECSLMIKYIANVRDESKNKSIGKELIENYSKLTVEIDQNDLTKMDHTILESIYCSLIQIHNELSTKTLPATPVSIKYTEFSKGGFLKRNSTINFILYFTLIVFVLFISLNILKTNDIIADSTFFTEEVCNLLLIVLGSALGAGFYTLITVRKYLVNRTYSPRYNPNYIIRLILGITSGSILVMIVQNSPDNYSYSTALIAIIGGFAADIVAVILTGMAESFRRALEAISGRIVPEQEEPKEKNLSSY